MSSPVLRAIISLACAFTFSAAQTSCRGRCGAEYYRGYMCQCDYECLIHDECCKDYESQCTTRSSCQGRCGESFKRGRLCNCDSDCVKYNQCCPDYKAHCGAEEAINGPASITPGKPSSCQNVNDNKPKDPSLNEPAEQPNVTPDTFNEGDNPASDPQDALSDDLDGQIFPNLPDDPYSENGLEDPEAGHIPESTSGYEPSQTDLLEPVPTDPSLPDSQDNSELEFTREETFTLFPETQKPPSDNKPTQANAKPSPSNPTNGEAPTESADGSDPEKQSDPTRPSESGATLPHPSPTSTAVSHVSMQPTPSSVPQTGPTPSDNTPEFQSGGQAEIQPEGSVPEAQNIDPTEASSDPLDVLPSDSDNPDSNQASSPAYDLSLPSTAASNAATNPTMGPESAGPTQGSSSAPESSKPTPNSQVPNPNISPSTSASSKPGQTPIPEATIPNTEPDGTNSESKDVPTITTSSPSGTQDPNDSDSQAPGSENEIEPSPESGARGDTPDSWNGPQNGALTTRAPSPTDPVQDDMVYGVTPGETTTDPLEVTPAPTKPRPSKPISKPQAKPNAYKPSPTKPSLAKPTSKPMPKPMDTEQTLNIDNPRDYQADDSNDTNICSGRPASALTTLRNGTMVVFRGHYFWVLDRNRVPGPARGITEVWGVPSPIDTVFTRCNCQGKTYILKGAQYWRYDNDVMDPGYPKLIQTGFDGLQGHVTAALSVPQYQRRKESVYFFKRGGLVQKYSYQFGTSPTCGRKVQYAVYTVRSRAARQAVSLLEPAINVRTSWRGFPSTVTSAVSVPSRWAPEGYKYYVFSRSKYYNVRVDSERPVIAAPQSPQTNLAKDFFKCPKKV